MNKLLVLAVSAQLGLFPAPYGAAAGSRFEKSALEKQELAEKVVWFSHEPLMFSRRRGRMYEDQAQVYQHQHDPENVRLMAALGARYGRLHFYKGIGLETEMPEIRNSMRTAALMHQLGMKVSLYVGGTMFIETFYRETPEAVSWEQRDQYGRPVPYLVGTQTFRHFPCPNEPAYRSYIKKVLKVGIDSLKTDQFFFDNYFLRREPKSCRCPRCQEAFRAFLERRYPTREEVVRRFGYPSVDYIKVNEWDTFNRPEDVAEVDDPVLQEWVRFRCESLADQCREFYDYIKRIDPGISVGFNLKGLYSMNRIWYNAVYHPLFRGKCDFFCFDIDGMSQGLDPETGALVSEVRSYKIARRLGMSCSNGDPGLELAEQMAFNHQKYLEGFGYHSAGYNHYTERVFSPLAEFFRCYNDRYYTETDNLTDVAVLRTWPSMAYSVRATSVPTVLMEQVLIQYKVPFDIVFDCHLDDLGRYQAVVLPGQESLSQANLDRLLDFVRKGGTLVFTGNTADFNEWRERRRVNPLLSLLGGQRPVKITAGSLGKGTLVYIPGIEPALPVRQEGVWDFPSPQWVLPQNHEAVYLALAGHLPRGLTIDTGAPLTTLMEIYRREKSRETIVHFVNFDTQRRLEPFPVELKKVFPGGVKAVEFFSAEFDRPQSLEFSEEKGKVRFQVPSMGLYSMVVVSH
ncbi:MAG: beta-galactosidase [Candidatus Glassbacteria bacterium]|nr:beta-galactosidase [Candidatus Glassbacteria bacterium]